MGDSPDQHLDTVSVRAIPWASAYAVGFTGADAMPPPMSEARLQYLLAQRQQLLAQAGEAKMAFGNLRNAVVPTQPVYPANSHWRDYDVAEQILKFAHQRDGEVRNQRRKAAEAYGFAWIAVTVLVLVLASIVFSAVPVFGAVPLLVIMAMAGTTTFGCLMGYRYEAKRPVAEDLEAWIRNRRFEPAEKYRGLSG